ncbi:CAAX prenyl protease-related protein [Thermodesulfatator indicus DSM 15286]|uniref:CAAX prenyl protease-related protein n=1 Tax=Thermodesulfatator indicus (strain DSM 15286 / JCM 11887 / CIR29812) TaxID=667014 RepID=F8ACS2_THEID|nr:CAAX prenyl protease-related protein [Thermodesulfatator indicus]AEH44713.1 CAAX prenyl protease-related protein [Thermodesulfatator indicus DSM 15286]
MMPKTIYYILPFALFLVLTFVGSYLPSKYYFYLYILKTFSVGFLLFYWRKNFVELYSRINSREILLALISGVFVLVCWVGGEGIFPTIGTPKAISPFAETSSLWISWTFIGIRLIGAAIMVPVLEELFWRSFLMRYLIDKDFYKVPLGAYTHFSFWTAATLFALEHFRVLPGFLAGVIYGGLLCYSKNIWVPILSHAITNLGLGLYVLITGKWIFW